MIGTRFVRFTILSARSYNSRNSVASSSFPLSRCNYFNAATNSSIDLHDAAYAVHESNAIGSLIWRIALSVAFGIFLNLSRRTHWCPNVFT